MAFLKNTVLAAKDEQLFRVLYVCRDSAAVWVFDLNSKNALPRAISRAELATWIADRFAEIADDPFPPPLLRDADMSPSWSERRDAAWAAIEPLVTDEPRIYAPSLRARIVAARVEKTGVSRPTLYGYLRRYWRCGCIANALVPRYDNCGGRGSLKPVSSRKRGRPTCDPVCLRDAAVHQVAGHRPPGLRLPPDDRLPRSSRGNKNRRADAPEGHRPGQGADV